MQRLTQKFFWLALMLSCVTVAYASDADSVIRTLKTLHQDHLEKVLALRSPAPTPSQQSAGPTLASTTQTISDDFNDGSLNQTTWQYYNAPVERNGAVTLADSTGNNIWLGTKQELYSSDQDLVATVDFKDLSISGSGMALFAMESNQYSADILLHLSGGKQSAAFYFYDGSATWETSYPLNGTAGKLKLVLNHTTRIVEGFIDEGNGWVSLGDSGTHQIPADAGLRFSLNAYGQSGTTTAVAFDNFQAVGNPYTPPNLGETGLFKLMTISSAGYNRQYRMLVPRNYDPSRPIGIVFGYQGYGNPYLEILSYGFEPAAESTYLINISIPVKVSGGYSQTLNASTNEDIRCTMDIFNLIKSHYQIDENRIYALGFSNGAYFSITLANTVPSFLAAINPNAAPNWSISSRLSRTDYACIGCGGNTDQYDSVGYVTAMRNFFVMHKMDGEFYVYKMGHSTPSDDAYVTPAKSWEDKTLDFFMSHPRNYQTVLNAPPQLGASFRDDFSGTGDRPDASRWRVEYFGPTGMLGDLAGCVFTQADGVLKSQTLGSGTQGGLCFTPFFKDPIDWKTSFTINASGSGLTLWPAVLGDMTGKVLALSVTTSGWAWQLADTHLGFRANDSASLHTLSSGNLPFVEGQTYTLELSRADGITWKILATDHSTAVIGTLNASYSLSGPVQLGFGLRTATGSAQFDAAEITSTIVNRSTRWTLY